MTWIQDYLDALLAGGAGATVALGMLLITVAVAIAIKGLRT